MVADLAGWCAAEPMLVVGAFRTDADASGAGPRSRRRRRGVDPARARRSRPRARSGDICALYADGDWSADDVSRLHQLTGGVPLRVHEQASEWARQRAGPAGRGRRRPADRGPGPAGRVAGRDRRQRRGDRPAARAAPGPAVRPGGDRGDRAGLEPCPYKGLARFEAADAADFFGRERLVAELVARLPGAALVTVFGPSGSGKSSLVRAGVLPALAAGVLPGTDRWRTVTMCPGAHPARELARQLAGVRRRASRPTGVLVFVDQFEEVFTLCRDEAERDEFIDRLAELVDDAGDGRRDRHPGRPSRPLRRLPGARRADDEQRRARRADARHRAAAGDRAPRPAGRARRSSPAWSRSSSPTSPAGPAPFPCCRPRWPRRGNAGTTSHAHAGRLPGRRRGQRRPGPHGRGRVSRLCPRAAGRGPPGAAATVRRRRRRRPRPPPPAPHRRGRTGGRRRRPRRARRARRPPAADRRPRHRRGRPRGAAARVAPAAHLARRGRAGSPAAPPARRRGPVVGGERPRSLRAVPGHPARRRRRLGRRPRRRPQRHASAPSSTPAGPRPSERSPTPAGASPTRPGPTGASSGCSPASASCWWWRSSPDVLFLRQRDRAEGDGAGDPRVRELAGESTLALDEDPELSISARPRGGRRQPTVRRDGHCRRRSALSTRRSRRHGSSSVRRRMVPLCWTSAPTATGWPPARSTRPEAIIWDAGTGERLHTLTDFWVEDLAFSPDGTSIALTSWPRRGHRTGVRHRRHGRAARRCPGARARRDDT